MTKIDPVEFDDMDRAYIPVNSQYLIQTKGKGSSFRIVNMRTHERWLITDGHLHFMLTELAHETHAELTHAQSKIEMLEAKLKDAEDVAWNNYKAVETITDYLIENDWLEITVEGDGKEAALNIINSIQKQIAELTAKNKELEAEIQMLQNNNDSLESDKESLIGHSDQLNSDIDDLTTKLDKTREAMERVLSAKDMPDVRYVVDKALEELEK